MTAKDQRSRKQKIFIVLMLGALNTITPFSIDMYLPAFPKIASDFHTTIGNVALSVSTYFLGFSIGQIVYGPLLDRFGRKRPLYVGLGLYIIATIGCVTSRYIETLLVIRFVQALCGCVASVAAMAMVRDFFPADQGSRIISLLVLILGVSPLLAPTAGGFIVSAFGWHYVFVVLAFVALIIWIFIFFFLPEGQQPDKTVSLKPKPIIAGFTAILTEPKFYVFALAGSFSFAGLFVYVAGSPAIFMDTFHTSAKMYGGIFAFLSVGFIGGSQLNHLLSRKYSNEAIFKTTIIIQVAVSILYLVCVSNALLGIGGNIAFLFYASFMCRTFLS